MKTEIYVKVEISPSSGYITVENMFHKTKLEEKYDYHVDMMKKLGRTRWETIEGFEMIYLQVTVEYDGRKKQINQDDVLKAFEREGLATNVGHSMFGGFYKPTKKLEFIISKQYNKRKELAGIA